MICICSTSLHGTEKSYLVLVNDLSDYYILLAGILYSNPYSICVHQRYSSNSFLSLLHLFLFLEVRLCCPLHFNCFELFEKNHFELVLNFSALYNSAAKPSSLGHFLIRWFLITDLISFGFSRSSQLISDHLCKIFSHFFLVVSNFLAYGCCFIFFNFNNFWWFIFISGYLL